MSQPTIFRSRASSSIVRGEGNACSPRLSFLSSIWNAATAQAYAR